MAYKLLSTYPLLWRSPDTLQIGFDRPLVVLDHLHDGHMILLDSLRVGMSLSGLRMLARSHGITDAELRTFLRALTPVLSLQPSTTETTETLPPETAELPATLPEILPERSRPRSIRLQWAGKASLLKRMQQHLRQGHPALGPDPLTVAIIVSRFLCFPEQVQSQLQDGTPHLPVIFSDQSVQVGPFIQPGSGPCTFCLYLKRQEEQPWLAEISSQTLNLHTASEQGGLFWLALGEVELRLSQLATHGFPNEHSSTEFSLDGSMRYRTWQPHPDCFCWQEDFLRNEMVA